MELAPFGFNIKKNSNGLISLTDIWRAANSPETKTPNKWQKTDVADAFIRATLKFYKGTRDSFIKTTKGKGGGSFAHVQIALEYAQYLDPKLALIVNNIFIERAEEEKNPQLAIDRAKNTWRKQGKSEKWIGMRLMSMEERKSFTSTLKLHGVTGVGYKDCTNAIYKNLWGGGADIVRLKKSIPEGSNCRDFMNEIELASVRLAELLAEENIETHNAFGNDQVKTLCLKASKSVATAITNNKQKNL